MRPTPPVKFARERGSELPWKQARARLLPTREVLQSLHLPSLGGVNSYMRNFRSATLCLTACLLCFACAARAATAPAVDSAPQSSDKVQEVTVNALRTMEPRALARAVSGFVASHAAAGTRINQIGRWHERVCPRVIGLEPKGRDFIVGEIQDVARRVGAPTAPAGKSCPVSVEIVFTKQPQLLLDRIAKLYRPLLGFFPASQLKQMTTFSHPIEAWYETGTRSMDFQLPVRSFGAPNGGDQTLGGGPGSDVPVFGGAQVDSETTAMGMQPSGVAGSHLGRQQRSEFVHVLIIADSAQLARYPLQSVADYLAFLSLTRMSALDKCAALPSITDLLADGCHPSAPEALTVADRAYLQALYASRLEQSLNLERGEVQEQMIHQIQGK